MAIVLTIPEAEAAYRATLEEREQLKKTELRNKWLTTLGLAAGFVVTLALILSRVLEPGLFLIVALLFAFTIVFGLDALFSKDTPIARGGDTLNGIRHAQRSWIESHGFQIPQGSFERLSFSTFLDSSEPKSYGVSQLIESATGRLISVVLRSSPEQGYQLFNTDGQALRSTSKVS